MTTFGHADGPAERDHVSRAATDTATAIGLLRKLIASAQIDWSSVDLTGNEADLLARLAPRSG